jgi:hypothetical protein
VIKHAPDGVLHQVCFWSETGGEAVLLQDAREGVAVFVRSRWWGERFRSPTRTMEAPGHKCSRSPFWGRQRAFRRPNATIRDFSSRRQINASWWIAERGRNASCYAAGSAFGGSTGSC